MSFFHYIDNGIGPTKLFIGGIHGKECKTTIELIKKLSIANFSAGQIYIYNFDESLYISTLKNEFYESSQGKKIISLIKYYNPDFYTEFHSYNIDHYNALIGENRRNSQGVPPLIDCEDHVLCSSVSPLIRQKYFDKETICKTIEVPSFNSKKFNLRNAQLKYGFNKELTVKRFLNFVSLITLANDRLDFENKILKFYPLQVKLAEKYVKEIFGENFPPY